MTEHRHGFAGTHGAVGEGMVSGRMLEEEHDRKLRDESNGKLGVLEETESLKSNQASSSPAPSPRKGVSGTRANRVLFMLRRQW